MVIIGKMFLNKGYEKEYKKRHDELWPEMEKAILDHGLQEYYINLDTDNNILYSFLKVDSAEKWEQLRNTRICKKWWAYMSDIMETNDDGSPKFIKLTEVFQLSR
ncbi:L-rhamnose mutarotase [Spiroplasma endosymbiont of Aspidapion aeneum]|uniref:L-rhamnose mutarotase n=1 Tax=Spiroplasma endosymbiont of Aspidapion aeneum TaxID=3066276 RepID=UPI00313B5A39